MNKNHSTMPTGEHNEGSGSAPDKRLIQLDQEAPGAGQARDINHKIDLLDNSLGELNAELESIRASVEQGLDRLSDNDLDLTTKVADTYKRLGELDNTYRALTDISASIDEEIRKLSTDISQVASRSSADLEKLEATAEVNNRYLNHQQEALAQRVEKLVQDSHATSSRLQDSIRDVQEKMLLAEHKLLAEIDALASNTQEQDELLAKNIDQANAAIESGKARIIKLQQVDEALDKRAQQLEHTTAGLAQQAEGMQSSISRLQDATGELTQAVGELQERTRSLQQESEHQRSLIAGMQKNLSQLAHNLFELGGAERRHFRTTGLALIVLALLLGGFALYQHSTNRVLGDELASSAQTLDSQISTVDSRLGGLSEQVDRQVAALNETLNEEVDALSGKLEAVDTRLEQLDEMTQSLDGRLAVATGETAFGGDNILHNANWIAKLPPQSYTIQIATVSDKKQLFEIAQRYGDYLQQPVAYYSNRHGQYVMLYGQFASDRIALRAAQQLPYRINWQSPQVRAVGSIQAQL